MERERAYVDAHGVDDEAIKLGIAWLATIASEAGSGTLIVPQVRHIESLSGIFSDTSRLKKNRNFSLGGTVISVATNRSGDISGAVLAIWTDDQALAKIEDRSMTPAICAIPWNRRDIDQWKAAFRPRDLRSQTRAEGVKVANPVVVAALRSLTSRVNLSSGLAHPSDHDAAVAMFRALRDAGEMFVPKEVGAWAASHGWRLRDSKELETLAQKILDRKGVRTRTRQPWREDIVQQWRRKVQEEPQE